MDEKYLRAKAILLVIALRAGRVSSKDGMVLDFLGKPMMTEFEAEEVVRYLGSIGLPVERGDSNGKKAWKLQKEL